MSIDETIISIHKGIQEILNDNKKYYEILKNINFLPLQELEFTKWIVGWEHPYSNESGIIMFFNEKTRELGASFTENIERRMNELQKEETTKNATHFSFALVDGGHDKLVSLRSNARFLADSIRWDELGIIPLIK